MLETAQPNRFQSMPRVTITVPEKNAQPYRFQLDRQSVTFGRGDENDIEIDSGSVSVSHAEMRRILGGYELVDLDSTNGIQLDGVKYAVIPLGAGGEISMGDVKFDFLLADDERAVLTAELPEAAVDSSHEFPHPSAKAITQPNGYPVRKSGGLTVGAIVLFLILTACAFFAGLAVRYQKDTGKSLIEAIQEKYQATGKDESPRAIPMAEPQP